MAFRSTTPRSASTQPKRLGRALAALLLLTAACGDDEPGKKPSRPDAGEPPDASEPVDAETIRDAGMEKDTGTPEEGLTGSCAIDSNKIYSVLARNEPFTG